MTGQTAASMLERALCASGLDWIVPDWPAPARVGALVTTRRGGVSAGPLATMNLGRRGRDEASALAENRRRLAAFLPSPPRWLDQVHGTAIATLTRESAIRAAPVADAAVTRERDVVCAILTADCLPVLFADRTGVAVGIAHAGWRGLAAGVLEATIAALCDLGVRREDLMAWLGPAIGPTRFEVGTDVRDAFCADDDGAAACFTPHEPAGPPQGRIPERAARRYSIEPAGPPQGRIPERAARRYSIEPAGPPQGRMPERAARRYTSEPAKWHADLYGLARRRLARGGVTRVSGGGCCTFTDEARFFSHRRDPRSGRMAAMVWLERE